MCDYDNKVWNRCVNGIRLDAKLNRMVVGVSLANWVRLRVAYLSMRC